MNAQAAPVQSHDAPQVAGVRVRPALPIALYCVLAVSAALGLWVQRNPGVANPMVERAAPWLFLVFAVGLAAYRLALAAANRYPASKAFFQVCVAAVFFLLLLPGSPVAPPVPEGLMARLEDPEWRVRALAAELVGLRPEPALASALVRRLFDQDETVRGAAHLALVRLNQGVDLGPADDPAARKAWEARFP